MMPHTADLSTMKKKISKEIEAERRELHVFLERYGGDKNFFFFFFNKACKKESKKEKRTKCLQAQKKKNRKGQLMM